MVYELFAISEEGTETIDSFDNKKEADAALSAVIKRHSVGKWENTTSLNHVVGFNVDKWTDDKKGD
jgi:hypothetical protein